MWVVRREGGIRDITVPRHGYLTKPEAVQLEDQRSQAIRGSGVVEMVSNLRLTNEGKEKSGIAF